MNRRISLVLVSLFAFCSVSFPQTLEDVLESVEENNPSLRSARLERESGELENRAEAMLDSPEVEFNYLWGDDEMGNRHDLRITQSIGFASLTGQKAGLASSRNKLLSLEYKAARQQILLEAKQHCIDLTYCNALYAELSYHLENADRLVAAYERKVELGGASVLELNNARLHRSTVQGSLMKVNLERERILLELQRLNGGQPVRYDADDFSSMTYVLPGEFETFFEEASEASPAINYVKQEMDVKSRQLGLDRTAWLPDLTVGYMSEIAQPEAYRGLTFGVSIPLWSNASRVRRSKVELDAARSRKDEAVQSFYYDMLSKYRMAQGLKGIAMEYRAGLDKADNREFLMKAEGQGEISIIEYITEIDLFYENLEKTLEAERDYQQALASLTSMML